MTGPGKKSAVDGDDVPVGVAGQETARCVFVELLRSFRRTGRRIGRIGATGVGQLGAAAADRKPCMAATVSSGADRLGQWPRARMSAKVLPGIRACT